LAEVEAVTIGLLPDTVVVLEVVVPHMAQLVVQELLVKVMLVN
jgi:hypothetical protein